MTRKPAIFQMQDFAYQDRRSVSAMLCGRGDGREKPFLEFEQRVLLVDPLLDDEKIGEFYSRQCRDVEKQRLETQAAAGYGLKGWMTWIGNVAWCRVLGHLAMGSIVAVILSKISPLPGW